MHLLDSTNMEVAQNDDYSPPDRNAQLTYSPSTSGTFVVVVRSYSEYSSGLGNIDWRSRTKGAGYWPGWTNLVSSIHFGGVVVSVAENQREYWTVAVQPAAGGTPDTVLYTMDFSRMITRFDDDSGVGRMDRITMPPFTSYPPYYLLVGAYSTNGATDVIANDLTPDDDGDTLGASLEAALGTCDSSSDSRCSFLASTGNCGGSTVTTRCDSDRDGLSDFHETFGVETSLPENALHLPAWGAKPTRKDVFLQADYVTAFTSNPWTYSLLSQVKVPYDVAPQAHIRNLEGNGIALHFDIGASGDPCSLDRSLCGAWGKGGTRTDSWTLATERSGVFRHVQMFKTGGVSGVPAWSFDVREDVNTIVHEMGHSLGLTHGGHPKFDETDPARRREYNCKPHYKSVMNYCYGAASDGFSLGDNTSILKPGEALGDELVRSVRRVALAPRDVESVSLSTGGLGRPRGLEPRQFDARGRLGSWLVRGRRSRRQQLGSGSG
jgi:hypothetical protein